MVVSGEKVIKEVESFYEELCKNKNIDHGLIKEVLNSLEGVVNKEDGGCLCDGISVNEVWEVVMKARKNRTPGKDGLPIEFYECMWDIVGMD